MIKKFLKFAFFELTMPNLFKTTTDGKAKYAWYKKNGEFKHALIKDGFTYINGIKV